MHHLLLKYYNFKANCIQAKKIKTNTEDKVDISIFIWHFLHKPR